MSSDLLEPTAAQKRKFYSQELFDDHSHLKNYLRIIILTISAGEIFRAIVIESNRKTVTLNFFQKWFIYLSMSFAVLCFLFSTLKKAEKRVFKATLSIRAIFLTVSSISLCVSVYFRMLWETRLSIESGISDGCTNPDNWLDTFTLLTTLAYGIVLADVLYPLWIMKTLLPLAVSLGLAHAIIEKGPHNQFVLLFRIVSSSVYFIALYVLKDLLRKKIFMKRVKDETWNRIQKQILASIPTSIAILDILPKKIIYVNEEFKKWSKGNNHEEFFSKVTNLTRIKDKKELFMSLVDRNVDGSLQYGGSFNLESSPERNLKSVDIALVENGSHQQEESFDFPSLSHLLNTLYTFYQLGSNGKLKKFIYDGTYYESPENTHSFEIKIICIENGKAIIMLNDTTQRDLVVSLKGNNQFKDNLLASISHELRTPLNGSLAFLESAVNSQEDSSISLKDAYLVPALRSSRLLLHIINDILDYSQLGSSTIKLAIQEFSIVQTIQECYSLLELQAQKKGLKFLLSLDDNIPKTFGTDHNRVAQVLLNLLGNAIKFSFEGEIRLEAIMLEPNVLKVSVSDTGIGIKGEELQRMFNKSSIYKGEKISENSTGVGFGLTVSQKLAKLLGPVNSPGLMIDTEFGKGSTFAFFIQRKNKSRNFNSLLKIDTRRFEEQLENDSTTSFDEYYGEASSPGALFGYGKKYLISNNERYASPGYTNYSYGFNLTEVESELRLKGKPKPNILIVDDDPFNILALESILKSFNVNIDTAYHGQIAIEKVLERNGFSNDPKNNYKLILMDFNMPVMNGHQATQKLKEMMKEGKIKKVKIVGCTAYNTKNDIETGLKSGMKDVITKPVAKNKVKMILDKYVNI